MAQSAAASFNPAHRLIRQYAEGPVQHGLMNYAEAEEKAIATYEQLLLPDPENIGYRFPHQVSGGQLQRAMVAMAMSCQPDIIIFDEPTTALDVTTQIEVLAAIKEITRRFNTAAIYITHDLAVVAQLADRIMVLRYGELVEENDAREMLAHPRENYTRDLLAVRSFKKGKRDSDSNDDVILEIEGVTASYTGADNVLEDIDPKDPARPDRGSGGGVRQWKVHPGKGNYRIVAAGQRTRDVQGAGIVRGTQIQKTKRPAADADDLPDA